MASLLLTVTNFSLRFIEHYYLHSSVGGFHSQDPDNTKINRNAERAENVDHSSMRLHLKKRKIFCELINQWYSKQVNLTNKSLFTFSLLTHQGQNREKYFVSS